MLHPTQMEAFQNRLLKVNKHISKWAKRSSISCFRIYDMDIPEFPFCIDRYEQFVHVAEYKTRHNMDDDTHAQWLESCMATISATLQVPASDIFLKERKRLSRREEQYEKVGNESKIIYANEGGLQFKINLTDYLDTGLFLDHRPLRQKFREEAENKNVLNLFAYTGSFSVYAAQGGAQATTTVDLSNTYLSWAKENFELNNLTDDNKHRFIQSDVMEFLKQEPDNTYDLVIVDPPAFSNSKRMSGTWDTQRDHSALLNILLQKVKPGAILYFSNNLRSFEPSFDRLKASEIKDISLKTIPEDFRNKKIHYCYRFVK